MAFDNPSPMRPECEGDLNGILSRVTRDLEAKYRKGQAEHGGNLWEIPIAGEIRAEALDLLNYSDVLLRQHQKISDLVDRWMRDPENAGYYAVSIKQILGK